MKQKLINLKALLCLLLLLVGVNASWGDTYTFQLTDNWSTLEKDGEWGTTYASHTITASGATLVLSSANHSTATITDCPVTKGAELHVTLTNSQAHILSAEIQCKQWGSKAQTVTLNKSTNGGTSYTATSTTNNNFSAMTGNFTAQDAVNAVQWTFSSSSNQVGVKYVIITTDENSSGKTVLSTPANLSSSNVTGTTADLSWDAVSNASSYKVKIGSTEYTTNTNSYKATGLEAETEHKWSVKALAGTSDTYSDGVYSAEATFTTGAFVATAGTYNIVPNNTFWGYSSQDGALSVTANKAFGPVTKYGISVSMNSGTSTNSYMKSDHTRVYNGYTVTIVAPAGFNLTSIVFTGSTWVAPTASVGTMNSKTWTGNANSVTFTFSGTSYMSNIAVTYAADKVLQSVAVSGTPTKTTYDAGDSFDPTGLTVTGTYDDNSTSTITSGITWSTPAALTAGQTSVDITATVNGVTSPSFTVTGLTVNAKDTRTTPTITMDDIELEVGENTTLSATSSANLPVSYTIKSGSDKVSLENGVLTATAIGSAVITAYTAENAEYKAASIDVNVTVTADSPKGIAGIRSQITSISSSNKSTFSATKLTDAVVTYVGNSSTPTIYVEDANAGIVIYAKNTDLVAGSVINGTVSGEGMIYQGLTEITSIDLSKATITTGGEIPCHDVTIAELNSNINNWESRRIKISNATVSKTMDSEKNRTAEIAQSENTITVYEKIENCMGSTLDIEGTVINTFIGYAQDQTTSSASYNEFCVWAKSDIVLAAKENTTVVFDCADGTGTAENPVAFTIGEENTFPTAVVKDSEGNPLAGASVKYSTTNGAYINVNEATGALELIKYASKSNNVKVTATYAGDATHNGNSAEYYLTIAKGTPVIAFTENTLSVPADATNAGLEVTVTKGENLTFTYSSSDETVASFADANSHVLTLHKAGTATITAQSVANDAWKQSEAVTYNLIVTPATALTKYVLVESQDDFVDGEYVIAINDNGTYKAMTSNLADGYLDATTVSVTDKAISTLNGATVWMVKTGTDANEYPIASFKNGTNYLSNNNGTLEYSTTEENFICYVNDGSTPGEAGEATVYASDWEHWFGFADGFMMSANSENAPSLYFFKKAVTEIAIITLNAACHDSEGMVYGTYSNSSAWVVPSDIIVSEISIVDNALYVEEYDEGDIVPANTGVMVSSTGGGDYQVTLSNASGSSKLGLENLLRPTGTGITAEQMMAANDANCTYYRLTMHNGTQIGFWYGAPDGAAFALGANKAYLAVPNDTQVKTSFWIGNNDATVINSVSVTLDENAPVYNLSGQRVSHTTKGIVIQNGKKFINK